MKIFQISTLFALIACLCVANQVAFSDELKQTKCVDTNHDRPQGDATVILTEPILEHSRSLRSHMSISPYCPTQHFLDEAYVSRNRSSVMEMLSVWFLHCAWLYWLSSTQRLHWLYRRPYEAFISSTFLRVGMTPQRTMLFSGPMEVAPFFCRKWN